MKWRFIVVGSVLGALLGGVLGLVGVLPATYSIIHRLTWETIASLLQATFFQVACFSTLAGAITGGIAGYRHWWYEQQG